MGSFLETVRFGLFGYDHSDLNFYEEAAVDRSRGGSTLHWVGRSFATGREGRDMQVAALMAEAAQQGRQTAVYSRTRADGGSFSRIEVLHVAPGDGLTFAVQTLRAELGAGVDGNTNIPFQYARDLVAAEPTDDNIMRLASALQATVVAPDTEDLDSTMARIEFQALCDAATTAAVETGKGDHSAWGYLAAAEAFRDAKDGSGALALAAAAKFGNNMLNAAYLSGVRPGEDAPHAAVIEARDALIAALDSPWPEIADDAADSLNTIKVVLAAEFIDPAVMARCDQVRARTSVWEAIPAAEQYAVRPIDTSPIELMGDIEL